MRRDVVEGAGGKDRSTETTQREKTDGKSGKAEGGEAGIGLKEPEVICFL